jgi:hypothetical protein
MRAVIILTGALRTIKKTVGYFQRHLIESIPGFAGGTGALDIFVCVQNDSTESNADWEAWFHREIRPRSIQWYSPQAYPDWVINRDRQIDAMTIEPQWKQYLRTSGSMIEYFQLQLAYMAMVRVEQLEGFRYHSIVRARTDTIYAKPLDFHWLAWDEAAVAARMKVVEREMALSGIAMTDRERLRWFMCTILSDDVLPNMDRIFADYRPCEAETILDGEAALTPARLLQYIQRGRYILTIRKNNLYVVRRSLFYMIPSLGTFYGSLRAPDADPWWFNAEGQFRDACYYSGITIFDYSTLFEEYSLEPASAWDERKFFDGEGRLLNPMMLYCVVRR